MAKKETSARERTHDELAVRRRSAAYGQRSGFRVGDLLLVLLAICVTAVMIFLGTRVIPSIRDRLSTYDEKLLFTVEYPVTLTDMLPQTGDAWTLLDSDGAICTVREVDYSEEEGICRVTLLRKNATYRDGEGYTIGGIRIAVGSKLYFCGVSDRYFAVAVLSVDTDRFPRVMLTEETDEPSPDGKEESDE